MLSLKERIELLDADLRASPPRVSAYRDLPFAILRYDPADECELRRELRLLGTRLQQANRSISSPWRLFSGRPSRRARVVTLADLGYGVLDTAMVETAAYCLEKVAVSPG